MKTSEMIAMLEEYPKLRFSTPDVDSGEEDIASIIHHKLCWDNDAAFPVMIHVGGQWEHTWQLVCTPVPWQEAIQAALDGKTVTCKDCKGRIVSGCECDFVSCESQEFSTSVASPCWEQIQTGAWFIID